LLLDTCEFIEGRCREFLTFLVGLNAIILT